ncbi:MAG: DUF1926 domain-containing protein [candidate division Zixibacteria bacterium]|nr:DUF1926 domain-containing protein [candidate division Zixibacteria bacterium]
MTPTKFVFAIHCHQPVGNFDFVFEDSYNRCYHPFLETLNGFPDFKCCLHYSGILLNWIEENRPEHFDMLRDMVSRGQLEMLSGGFYEPVLAVIPDEDKIGQITKLSDMIESTTGKRPQGMWLAERVWEPHLPQPLAQAGIKYVIVDDTHFKYSGLNDNQLDGYYIAEEAGEIIRVFPSSKFLRYSIPFKDHKDSVEYLSSFNNNSENPVIVYADDAEKFGIWPGTHKLCYTKKWLGGFFKSILNSSDSVKTAHFSDVINELPAKGNIYLPTASYAEMMEWSLPSKATAEYKDFEEELKSADLYEKYGIFVRGGFWRNFLAKYPESNNIHKKMLWVHKKIKEVSTTANSVKKKKLIEESIDEKRKGQCNDPYWHGVFGGLYLNNLRTAVYERLIKADTLIDEVKHNNKNWVDIHITDFNCDGYNEFLVETPFLNIYLSPDKGGSIFELDYKERLYNFTNTLSRREEPYHKQILENLTQKPSESDASSIHDMVVSKEEGLEKLLQYDWYNRTFLIDHFFRHDMTFEQFTACSYPEQGDFVEGRYDIKHQSVTDGVVVTLSRDGHVWEGADWCPVKLVKELFIPSDSSELKIKYNITNNHHREIGLWFGCECNLSMLDGQSDDRYYIFKDGKSRPRNLASVHQLKQIQKLGIEDIYLKLRCKFSLEQSSDIWLFPIQTVSLSEAGFEKVYQSSVILPHWKFGLTPGDSKTISFKFIIENT